MINTLLVAVTKPLGVELSALGLRTVWACHENAFDAKLLFTDDGVWCATQKDGYHTAMIQKLLDAGGTVFCTRESLELRGIPEDSLLEGIQVIAADDLAELCEDCESVNFF